jgi:undecaprenyl-diphosphatase
MDLNFWHRLILALLQSVLEWLPVSSEGFLVMTMNAFQIDDVYTAIRIAMYFHLGTAIAVLFKYRKEYIDVILLRDKKLLRLLVLSVLFTAMVAIPIKLVLEKYLSESVLESAGWITTLLTGIALLITGSLLQWGATRSQNSLNMEDRKIWDEIGLGAVQGFAILPGISRSGVTYTYLLARGFKKEEAFKMSFLISLPAVLAGIAFDLIFDVILGDGTFPFELDYLFLMVLVAVIGYFAMDALLILARKVPFHYVCFLLGGITILLVLIFFAA